MPKDSSETLPDFIIARSNAQLGGLVDFNIELGLLTKKTFNANSTSLATGGGGGSVGGTNIVGEIIHHELPPCFIGTTTFTLEDRTTCTFAELYEYRYKHCLSFDDDDQPIQGKILDVFRKTVYEYLKVQFDDGSVSGVVAEHRYYVPEGKYISIKNLKRKFIMDEKDNFVRVQGFEKVIVPKGIYVYNAQIDVENYCADRKRCHNRKPDPP